MKLAFARHTLAAALVATGLAFGPALAHAQSAPQQAAQKSERYKVVLQVSDGDPAKWNLAFNIDVEIVAYEPGLPMLKADSKVAGCLAQALDNNIGLMACENTMRNTKVEKTDMYGGISYVDAGVVHIMKRQHEGWAYVRP